jgi:hypothetical protein
MGLAPMESKRSLGVKSLRAAGRKPVKNESEDLRETHLRPCPLIAPPQNLVKKERVWRRFAQIANVSNQAFTLSNGHDQFLVVTSTLGAAVPYVDSWRIRRIRVWVKSDQDGAPVKVSISPVGASSDNMNNDPEAIFFCESTGPSLPGRMEIKTCKNRPIGAWHYTSTTGFASTIFQMNVTQFNGTYRNVQMDIEFETITNLVGLPLGYGATTATTTLGTVGGRNILSGFQLNGINNLG